MSEKQSSLKSTRGHVTTWINLPSEVNAGHCVTLATEKLGVWGAASEKAAMTALARKLEELAAEVRALASKAGA